ncbi:hypothetical protein CVT24_009300 [Panaeolus cyanescens]|uniref:Glucanase n=1 Tax=Panaeolus cyanescens TaxID=181874 RepID=A0A409Y833_9AGAR|nr:hypothetical protein CVT24_009300 [Panaeolus cyanescens]
MFPKLALIALTSAAVTSAQLVGTYQTENHPRLPFQRCTKSGGCVTASNGQVVLDSNWRWTHSKDGYTNCYTGNTWNTTACPNNSACAANCAIEGADYSGTYGITTSGNALTLKFVTNNSNGKNVGSRVYLMDGDTRYELFKLMNQEFTFDVDVSNLPCGLNGALYFSEMDADGGLAKYSTNKAGAKYGTGYCDSQCPKDIKWINGLANAEGWKPSATDKNAGNGRYGTCCNEMDIWEANSISTAYTPHPCTIAGPHRCDGTACNDPVNRYSGTCDPDGCDFNSYRLGDRNFYGPGKVVDTKKKMTVVTQFHTTSGTASGALKEIRRIYVQDGKVIQNSKVNFSGLSAYDSVTTEFCTETRKYFKDFDSFAAKGGMPGMEKGLRNGMVLALSIWDDHHANMLWLDSSYPTDKDPNQPGIARGSCPTTGGKPADVEANNANASVTFSNIKVGDIGSTFSAGGGSTTTGGGGGGTPTSTGTAPGPTQTKYGQCGGQGWTGPTQCASGSTCVVSNPWYSQCL